MLPRRFLIRRLTIQNVRSVVNKPYPEHERVSDLKATCKDYLQVRTESNALTRQQQVRNLHKFNLKATFRNFRQVKNLHEYWLAEGIGVQPNIDGGPSQSTSAPRQPQPLANPACRQNRRLSTMAHTSSSTWPVCQSTRYRLLQPDLPHIQIPDLFVNFAVHVQSVVGINPLQINRNINANQLRIRLEPVQNSLRIYP